MATHDEDVLELDDLRLTTTELMGPQLSRLQTLALGAAALGLVLLALAAFMWPASVYPAYLHGFLLAVGLTTGSLGLLLLHHAVGGGWAFTIRRFLEAGAKMLPVVAVLGIPLIIGLFVPLGGRLLYEWNDPAHFDNIILAKRPYLNPVFFIVRYVLYFIIWGVLAFFAVDTWGKTQYERTDREISNKLNLLGGAGLVVMVLTVTFMSVDWVMSINPHWFSSIFGLFFSASNVLTTFAAMLVLISVLAAYTPIIRKVPTGYFRDLGNFTLAVTMLWAYMAFSQYLIIYSGNLIEEIPWYINRNRNFWVAIPTALVALHFALPFLVLLTGDKVKRDPKRLGRIAGLLLFMRLVDHFWLVTPTFRETLSLSPADVGAPLFVGGVWLWFWAQQVKDKPVAPLYDPRFAEGLREHAHAVRTQEIEHA